MLVLDEIHKFPRWKNWLKGLFDTYEHKLAILVTGSAKLNVYKQGQDSMMGRYYLYHIHPLSVAELVGKFELGIDITPQQKIDDITFNNLFNYGGFPEPFIAAKKVAHSRWAKERNQQLIKEDLRDITQIREISQIQLLARMLSEQVGQNTSYSSLARKIQVSHTTIKQWLETLKYLYHSFHIRPWSKNITRSLIKEPKYYLWDWSQIKDGEARRENFVASHLFKATHYWTEIGLGTYELFYLRDKQKREVDFIVVKNDKPWFLVEVKTSENNSISPALKYFHEITKAPHAFQLTFNSPYADVNCFSFNKPIKVSAKTFLSQLV